MNGEFDRRPQRGAVAIIAPAMLARPDPSVLALVVAGCAAPWREDPMAEEHVPRVPTAEPLTAACSAVPDLTAPPAMPEAPQAPPAMPEAPQAP